MRSDAPFIAWGRASKLEATLKNPPSRTTCATRSRSPSASRAWASTLTAQRRAASRAGSRAEFGRELAFVALGELAVLAERELAGDEQKGSGAHERAVIGGRRRGLGENDAELLEALCGFAHQRANSSNSKPDIGGKRATARSHGRADPGLDPGASPRLRRLA